MRLRHGVSGIGIIVSMLLGAGAASPIQWQPTLDAARAVAAQTNRLVLIHFWGEGCPPCARMDSDVFSRPDVADTITRNYVAVRVDRAQFPNIAAQFGVSAVPTDVIVTPQGRVIGTYVGAVPPQQFMGRLEQIASIHSGPPAGMHAQQAPASSGVAWGAPPAQAVQPARRQSRRSPDPRTLPRRRLTAERLTAACRLPSQSQPRQSSVLRQYRPDFAVPPGYGSNPNPTAPTATDRIRMSVPPESPAYTAGPRSAASGSPTSGYPANPGAASMPANSTHPLPAANGSALPACRREPANSTHPLPARQWPPAPGGDARLERGPSANGPGFRRGSTACSTGNGSSRPARTHAAACSRWFLPRPAGSRVAMGAG